MIPLKICGMTNLEDAVHAVEAGANAVGFIFYQKSPRYVSPELVKTIIRKLPRGAATVGVFVNHEAEKIKETLAYCGLDFIQLHGDETPEFCCRFPSDRLIKAVSLQQETDIAALKDYPVRAILVDSRDAERYGGTGKISNWKLAEAIKKIHPLILSGGLNAGNIQQAIETVAPDALDINSGVESSPGKKDSGKIKELIEIIKKREETGQVRLIGKREIFYLAR
jgi:phosphoribosylanthranilate isomerase